MIKRLLLVPALLAATFLIVVATPRTSDAPTDLIVHEWGTFTSIAGPNGSAVEWMPTGGPTDLPCFVNSLVGTYKFNIRGTIRMETPVLYFYSPRIAAVDVQVDFPQGVISEWYPQASLTTITGEPIS